MVENADDAILLDDLEGKAIYRNPAYYKQLGFKEGDSEVFAKIHPDDLPLIKRKMVELNETGLSSVEYRVKHHNRSWVHRFSRSSLLYDQQYKPYAILSVIRDTTKQKIAEEKLRESEEKYQTTFESSMDALMLLDEKGFFDCNKATLELFGCKTIDEFTKKHPANLSPPTQLDGEPSMEAATRHINRALDKGMDHFFWIHRRIDGETFPADVLLTRIKIKEKNVLQATVRDITQQKEAEERLKQAEEKHRTLLNAANVLVQSVDGEGRYLFVNEEWKKMLGYTDSDLKSIKITDIVRKDYLQYCMNIFKRIRDGLSINDVETVFVAKNGKELVVSGNVCPVFKDGKFVSTVAFFVDMTERKKNEEKLKESSRRIELMNEKLRVVGSLTRHDVRNKLSTITGYSYILKKKHKDETDIVDGLDKMVQAVAESMKIFDFAKAYEQSGIEDLVDVDVEKVINEAVDMFSGLPFKVINNCHGLAIRADSLLRQLIYNFIDNTRKYGQKTTAARLHYRKLASDNLQLIYEDDGAGIPLENKKELFKQGFSTGGSTGFGLFLSKKMIDVYGWAIRETGKPGEGAKFVITIPKSKNDLCNYKIN